MYTRVVKEKTSVILFPDWFPDAKSFTFEMSVKSRQNVYCKATCLFEGKTVAKRPGFACLPAGFRSRLINQFWTRKIGDWRPQETLGVETRASRALVMRALETLDWDGATPNFRKHQWKAGEKSRKNKYVPRFMFGEWAHFCTGLIRWKVSDFSGSFSGSQLEVSIVDTKL